jgi:ADP-heptose:LPS heptosyltransferase
MNIAILRRNGLGDLLCAVPLVLYLQHNIPEAAITLFVDQRNAPLIPYLPPVKEVVIFSDKGNKYWNLLRTAFKYRNKFELAISAKTSPMKLSNLFLYGLRAKERVAYVDHSWHSRLINRPFYYNHAKAKQMHQALKSLNLVAPNLNEMPEAFYPRISVPAEIKKLYEKDQGVKGKPVILLSASTTQFANRPSVERYTSFVNQLYDSTSFSVMVIAQAHDQARAHAISCGLRMENRVYFPRNFDEFMVLLDAADLFFVGDGGIAHIGAALGKQQVVLFGAINPAEWRPLSNKVEVFFHPLHVDHLSDQEISLALRCKLALCYSRLNSKSPILAVRKPSD